MMARQHVHLSFNGDEYNLNEDGRMETEGAQRERQHLNTQDPRPPATTDTHINRRRSDPSRCQGNCVLTALSGT